MPNSDFLPVNPCEGCEYNVDGCPVFKANRLKICEKFRTWKSNLAATSKVVECLVTPNQYGCFDYSWETPDGKIHHGIDVVKLQSLLTKIKEANSHE
jgi:hypothetical protein